MSSRVALGLYSAVTSLALAPLLPALLLHPRLRGGLWQRLGWRTPCEPTGGGFWFHGSSAGDVAALAPLIERVSRTGAPVSLSSWTRSGELLARTRLDPATPVFRQPLDLAGPVRAVIRRHRPRALVLECLELWPRLVSTCLAGGVKVAIVNGRLSERSLRGYRRLGWLFRPCFEGLSFVSALSEEHARRFVAAGTPAERVLVRSSSKHAVSRPPGEFDGESDGRPCLVLGSIHPPEERRLLPWIPRLLAAVDGLEVVVAPRHPHRASGLVRRLRRAGLDAARLSAVREAGRGAIRVLDTVGPLAEIYRRATVAFVGGSLVARGGHNVVEPAAGGAFVVSGPHLEHCAEEARALRAAGVAAVVNDGAGFCAAASERLVHAARTRARTREAAVPVLAALAGAADEVASRLVGLVG